MFGHIGDQHHWHVGHGVVGFDCLEHLDPVGVVRVELAVDRHEVELAGLEFGQRVGRAVGLFDGAVEMGGQVLGDRGKVGTAVANVENFLGHVIFTTEAQRAQRQGSGEFSVASVTPWLVFRFNRKQMGSVADVQHVVGDDRGAVDAVAHVAGAVLRDPVIFVFVESHRDLFVGRVAEDGDFAVFVADVDFVFDDQRRAPGGGQHVVRPMDFARLCVEAVEQSTKVGNIEHVVANRDGAAAAVHGLFEVDLVIAVLVEFAVVPDHGRVRIRAGEVAFLGDDGLHAFVLDDFVWIGRIERELRTDVAAFVGIDAPKVSDAFAVFGVLTDRDINVAFVNYRG